MRFCLSLLSLEIIGAAFVLFLAWKLKVRFSLSEFVSLSFLAGIGISAYVLFIYGLRGGMFSLFNVSVISAVFLLLAVCLAVLNRGRVYTSMPFKEMIPLEKLLLAGVIIQVVWGFLLVIPIGVHSHDAVANYALKAKIFYLSGGIPEGFFNWPESTVAHPDYPLLLPLLMTWVYEFTGFNDIAINLIMPVIYVAFLVLFYDLLRKFFGRAYSMLAVFVLATIPQLADYATLIHADLLLAVFTACAFGYFVLYVKEGMRPHLVISSVLFGFSLWIKNEAMVFVCAFVLCLVVYALRSRGKARWPVLFTALGVMFVISAPWFAARAVSGVVNSDMDFASLTAARLLQNVKDIPILLNLFQQEVFGPKKWNIFWVLVFGCCVWKWRTLLKGEVFYMTLFLFVAASGYFAGYMLTTGSNLYFLVNTTISRFMLHFSGAAMLFLAVLMYGEFRDSFMKAGER